MKKRFLSAVLSLCMALTIVPGTTLAVSAETPEAHSHPVCGAEHTDIGNHTDECQDLVWQIWDGSDMDPDTEGVQLIAGNWYLEDDIAVTERVTVSGDVNLCFNGKFVKSTGAETFETVSGVNFNICDCSDDERKFTVNEEGLWVLDDENGTKTLTGGGITGVVSNGGVAITVSNSTCRMFGGNIVGNLAKHTPGYGVIHARNGFFAMYGGNICGNVAEILVYGNYRDDKLYIYGGNICNNIVFEGAICVDGDLHLSGEFEIYNNIHKDTGMSCDVYEGEVILCGEPSFTNPIALGDSWATVVRQDNTDISEYADKFICGLNNGFTKLNNSGKKILVEYYDVTQTPEKDNNYTILVNNENDVNYKWYYNKSVALTAEMGNVFGGYAYDEDADLWSFVSDDTSNEQTIIEDVYLENGDIIKFLFINNIYDNGVWIEDIDGSLDYISSHYNYEYKVSKSTFYRIYFKYSTNPDFRAVILKSSEELDDQTANVLDTTNLKSGYYKYEVIWDKGTSDNEKDDYNVTGRVACYTESISGDLYISGKPVAGKTLKAKYDGIEQVTYQWYRDNDAIADATGKKHTLTNDDIGAIIKVVVSDANGSTGEVSAVTTEILSEDPNPEAPDYSDETILPKIYRIKDTDIDKIAKTFEGIAEVTKNSDNATVVKLTKDVFGAIYVDGQVGDIIIDLNGKTITPDILDEAICNKRTNGTITVTGSGILKKGADKSVQGTIYFALEDGKDYYTVTKEDGSNLFYQEKLIETKSKSSVWDTITVTQNMFTDYTVKFNRNGGYGNMDDQIINVGEATALSANTFNKYNMTFAGWATSADGEVVYSDREVVTDITTKGQTITLYAVWEEIPNVETYTVSFDANGGTGAMADVNDVLGDYVLPANEFVAPEGKQFKAWSVGCNEKAVGETINVTANTTVTAVWEEIPRYTVSFDANGGTVDPATATTEANGKLASLPAPTRTGSYNFKGWYTSASGGTQVTVDNVYTEDTTIYAQWTHIGESSGGGGVSKYTVKFETNGGTAVANKLVTENTKLAEPTAPTKEGYKFDGWYTDKELTIAYDFASKVTKGFTLYAKWTELKKEPEGADAEKEPEVIEPDTTIAFNDVKADKWFYKNVQYVVENNLMNGITKDEFAPDNTLTRAMLVTVLYRNAGEPATNRSIPFADVDMGTWYANAVVWAKQNEIVNGVSENEFSPDASITREQIAAVMFRYAQYKGMDAVTLEENLHFADANEISGYAVSAMNWAVGTGLIKGKSATTISPKDNATRAEIAAVLQRFIEANK